MKSSDNYIKIKSRDNNVELLRIILMFMIVILHMISHGLDFIPSLLKNEINRQITSIHIFIFNITIIGVNSFIIISGYYGVKFKKETLFSLAKQAVASSLIILIFYYLIIGKPNLKLFILSFVPILSNYWWYLSTYVLLLILSPFINRNIEKLDKNEFTLIVVLLFLCNSIGGFFFGTFNANQGYSILNFLFLYIFAQYCKVYNLFDKVKVIVPIYLGSLIINFIIGYFLYEGAYYQYFLKFYNYNNPLIIFNSFFLVIIFLRLQIKTGLRNLSKLTLGIYLFHDNDFVRSYLPKLFSLDSSIQYIFIVGIFIFLIAGIVEFCRQKLFKFLKIDQ